MPCWDRPAKHLLAAAIALPLTAPGAAAAWRPCLLSNKVEERAPNPQPSAIPLLQRQGKKTDGSSLDVTCNVTVRNYVVRGK